jgi:hypothetical protein
MPVTPAFRSLTQEDHGSVSLGYVMRPAIKKNNNKKVDFGYILFYKNSRSGRMLSYQTRGPGFYSQPPPHTHTHTIGLETWLMG